MNKKNIFLLLFLYNCKKNNKMGIKDLSKFGNNVKNHLEKDGRTQRWLLLKLKNSGINLTDTQLSNKLNNFSTFNEEEAKEINKALGTKY